MAPRLGAIAGGIATAPLAAWAADAPVRPCFDWGPHMMWGMGWGAMIFAPLLMLLVFGLVIAAVVLIVRSLVRPRHEAAPFPPPRPGPGPVDILKERFARGEIDKAEFEERRRALGD